MKKLMYLLASLVLLVGVVGSSVFVYSAASMRNEIYVNGELLPFEVPEPLLIDNQFNTTLDPDFNMGDFDGSHDRVMVPLRGIAEAFGADISWNGDTRTVTVTHNGRVTTMQIGNPQITVGGVNVTLDIPPMIVDLFDLTFVPIRAIAEIFDAWVASTTWGDVVAITSNELIVSEPPLSTAEMALVGEWRGEPEPMITVTYVFNADRSGFRRSSLEGSVLGDEVRPFRWIVSADGYLLNSLGLGWDHEWLQGHPYSIAGNVLTLENAWGNLQTLTRVN